MAATGESVRPVDYDEESALGSTWKSLRVQHLLYVVVGESAAYRIYQGKIAGDILRRQIVRGDIDHVRAFIYRFPGLPNESIIDSAHTTLLPNEKREREIGGGKSGA